MRKKRILIIIVLLLIVIVAVVLTRCGKGKAKNPADASAAATTHTVAYGNIDSKIEITGELQPETVVAIKSRVSGKIVKFYVDENDFVTSGQIIADIEPDYVQANTLFNTKATLQLAEITLAKARKDHQDNQVLLANSYISQSDFDHSLDALKNAEIQFEQASRQYEMIRDLDVPGKVTHVFATASGTVIERSVNEGEMVSSSINSYGEGTVVMRIADLNRMIVKSNINEVDIAKFQLKQKGTIKLDALPYEEFSGEIVKIAPMAITENNAKVFPVEISINATGKQVKPGMTAAVSIIGDTREHVIVVPIGAVFADENNQDIVYLLPKPAAKAASADTTDQAKKPDGKKTKTPKAVEPEPVATVVKLGANDFQMVEVISGLAEGDVISLKEPSSGVKAGMMMY
ncbi:MAG TPA: efflux RND transporter periplasmic adaptor subunit [Candidatus Cloacimonadota bacterium]|nr:efflux RND transporter periplasmic adaptor subunit [Candidatus Cloacimonadota bacterium]